jgi:hypothetical protein
MFKSDLLASFIEANNPNNPNVLSMESKITSSPNALLKVFVRNNIGICRVRSSCQKTYFSYGFLLSGV